MGLKQQTTKQALTTNRLAATVEATKPTKIGGSFVLDFSNPRHAKREQQHCVFAVDKRCCCGNLYLTKQQQPTGNKAMQETVYTTNDPAAAAKHIKRMKGPLFIEMVISSQLHDPELVMVVKSEMAYRIESTVWTDKEFRFNRCKNGFHYLHISDDDRY